MTDTSHNVKNGRYQMLIGEIKLKTIGHSLIDTGMLSEAKVAKEL